jgi:spectinomycin phosphotransferase
MYARASGRPADPAALALYRTRWFLDDLSIFVNQFRSAHRQTADLEHAWRSFTRMFESGFVLP